MIRNICFSLILVMNFASSQADTLGAVQMFHNVNTPVPALEEMIDIKVGDRFKLQKAKRLRLRFYESGFYSDVSMLFFKKEESVHLQYYFKEEKRTFLYSLSPYISIRNNLGLQSSIKAKDVFESSTNIGFGFAYSKDDYFLRLSANDRYWKDKTEFKMSIDWYKENYLFTDLAAGDRYDKEGVRSEIDFIYRIAPEESAAIKLRRNNFTLSSANALESDHRVTSIGLEYAKATTDWPLFPQSGYEFVTSIWYASEKDAFRSRSSELLANYYRTLGKHFLSKIGLTVRHNHDKVPHYLAYHLDLSKNSNAIYSSNFYASSYAMLSARIFLLGTIEYDPFFTNKFMLGASAFSHFGKYKDVKNDNYWQIGASLHLFWRKNKIDISLSRDIFDSVFLQINTAI